MVYLGWRRHNYSNLEFELLVHSTRTLQPPGSPITPMSVLLASAAPNAPFPCTHSGAGCPWIFLQKTEGEEIRGAVAAFEVIDEGEKRVCVVFAVVAVRRRTAETRDAVRDALDSGLREHQILIVGSSPSNPTSPPAYASASAWGALAALDDEEEKTEEEEAEEEDDRKKAAAAPFEAARAAFFAALLAWARRKISATTSSTLGMNALFLNKNTMSSTVQTERPLRSAVTMVPVRLKIRSGLAAEAVNPCSEFAATR